MPKVPDARAFTPSPLRNRIRVELRTSVADVWELLGDFTRYPEYSAGLDRVDVNKDPSGAVKDYVCHFKPQQPGGESVADRQLIRWYEPNRGYASLSDEPNAFRLRNCLTLVILEPSKEGTLMTWDEYYDAEDLATNRAEFDRALADIAARLVARFGGRLVERHVDGPR